MRCVAKYVHDHGIAPKERVTIETGRGVLTLDLEVAEGKARRIRSLIVGRATEPSDLSAAAQAQRKEST